MNKLNRVYIGLGTNLGNKIDNLKIAYKLIEETIGVIIQESSVYATLPWGFDSNEKFYNSVIIISTTLSPEGLLEQIKVIESTMGRDNSYKIGYSSRIIDIDILDFNGLTLQSNILVLPHPQLENRNFVLFPIKDVDPNWNHPISNKSIDELLIDLKSSDSIEKVII